MAYLFPGGHWPRKGVWGCAALKTPFSRLTCSSQGSHFKQKSQFTRPLLRKFGNFSLYSLKIYLTSPQIWKFSAHKPPNLEILSSQAPNLGLFSSQAPLFRGKYQFTSPTVRKSGPHTPTWKKVECPPPGISVQEGSSGTRFDHGQFEIKTFPIYAPSYCLAYLNFKCHIGVSQTICYRMVTLRSKSSIPSVTY